jgi:hypothetical protein
MRIARRPNPTQSAMDRADGEASSALKMRLRNRRNASRRYPAIVWRSDRV